MHWGLTGHRNSVLVQAIWTTDALHTLHRHISRLEEPSERQVTLQFGFQVVRHALETLTPLKRGVATTTLAPDSTVVTQRCTGLMLLGVTDVWSAIRSECAQQTAELAFFLPSLDAIDAFVDRLVRVAAGTDCINQETKSRLTRWSEQDGALRTLACILGAIHIVQRPSDAQPHGLAEATTGSRVASDIKGGFAGAVVPSELRFRFSDRYPSVSRLPRALVHSLKPVLYQCLRHEQLSVRERAAECLKHHVDLSAEPMRLLVLQEVMSKLNRMRDNSSSSSNNAAVDMSGGDHELLEAFEAEGLLDVLSKVAPSLPPLFLLKHWKLVFPTLERYVMHIASSVRQKSSAVVLAFARLSQVPPTGSGSSTCGPTNAALELLSEMMLALSEPAGAAEAVSSCCWQQKEGRLLSIEALGSLLGVDFVHFSVGRSALHFVDDESRQSTRTRLAEPEDRFWACIRPSAATWTVSDDELKALDRLTPVSDRSDVRKSLTQQPLIDALDAFLGTRATTNSSDQAIGFWRRVLCGWLAQTRLAFASNQFELRRISRQVLPGLLRLILWTNESELLPLLTATSDDDGEDDDGWRWSCVKFALLHLQFLSQSIEAKRILDNSKLTRTLTSGFEAVWCMLRSAAHAGSGTSNPESTIVRTEAQAMAFLSFYSSQSKHKLAQAYKLLEQSLDTVHSNFPAQLQLDESIGVPRSRANATVDRQLSISFVDILPALVRALESIDARTAVVSRKSWLILERAALGWLAADDMFRWITVDQNAAHTTLMRTLSQLLGHIPTGVDTDTECLLLMTHVEAWATARAPRSRGDVTTLAQVLPIHLAAWRASSTAGAARLQISAAIVRVYSQLVSFRHSLESKAVAVADRSLEQSSWDDWDGDDGLRSACLVSHNDRPSTTPVVCCLASGDSLGIADQAVANTASTWRLDERASLVESVTSAKSLYDDDEHQYGYALVALLERLRV